jgi:sulfite reductase (NADPH) flavoprotein alpha-component
MLSGLCYSVRPSGDGEMSKLQSSKRADRLMSQQPVIPFIPESAPFTPAQRAWLNGFLAGMFAQALAPRADQQPAPVKPKVNVLFGSQSGNAESIAKRLVKEAKHQGYDATFAALEKANPSELAQEKCALIVTSTWGDGDPPDNAVRFWEALSGASGRILENLNYSVLALGDTNYEHFCGFGKNLDNRLESLGAKRILDRIDCNVDFEEGAARWQRGVFDALKKLDLAGGGININAALNGAAPLPETKPKETERVTYSRKNPFPARLLVNRKLTAEGSQKDTRHYEISLAGSGLVYEPGDALGVMPTNSPELVDDILKALSFDGGEEVTGPDGAKMPIRLALLREYHIREPRPEFLNAMAEQDDADQYLKELVDSDVRTELDKFLWGREIVDFLIESPGVKFAAEEFVSLLKKLQPRLYSIASSLKAHPEQVHLTIDTVRYEIHGRNRKGVCSNFLAERAGKETPIPVFIQVSKHFRVPTNSDTPMIMVGPGTGIAPFRAFLEERKATGAKGHNWLFFGAQKSNSDFFYKEELEGFRRDGVLTRLDTAFSRDQEHKIYVQTRMMEHAKELWDWLEQGAHFYVCGDATRMAKDVDKALYEIVQIAGGRSEEAAGEYIQKLRSAKRYQRDVY